MQRAEHTARCSLQAVAQLDQIGLPLGVRRILCHADLAEGPQRHKLLVAFFIQGNELLLILRLVANVKTIEFITLFIKHGKLLHLLNGSLERPSCLNANHSLMHR